MCEDCSIYTTFLNEGESPYLLNDRDLRQLPSCILIQVQDITKSATVCSFLLRDYVSSFNLLYFLISNK